MKTQIIHLDDHDDIISVRDKMAWGQVQRILLIWPDQGKNILDRDLDLILLQRHANDLGAQLALVTRDTKVKFNAFRMGIPIFPDAQTAHNGIWSRRRRRKRFINRFTRNQTFEGSTPPDLETLKSYAHPVPSFWSTNIYIRSLAFILALSSVLSLAMILFPRANINLSPQIRTQKLSFRAFTNSDITSINPTGAIPTKELSVVVEGRLSVESSGTTAIPDESASGKIVLTNLTNQVINIPKGTIVRTQSDPVMRYATLESTEITNQVGQSITITVQAIAPGPSGNVKKGEINAIEGDLGLQLSVNNPTNITGGSELFVPIPLQLDRRNGRLSLISSLKETAIAEIKARLTNGDILLSNEPDLLNTLEETYVPEDKVPSDQVTISLRLEFGAKYISREDLVALSQIVLESSLPSGFYSVPESLKYNLISNPDFDSNNNSSWEISTSQTIKANLENMSYTSLILGTSPGNASNILMDNLFLKSNPVIRITPSWWPRIPFLPYQVNYIISDN